MADFPPSTIEPFDVGRSAYRFLFDFGVMLSRFSPSPNKRVLDLSAGTGWISVFLNRMGYEAYSFDFGLGCQN